MSKWWKWAALLLIIIFSWVELQYVNESSPEALSPNTRKLLHTLFYTLVALSGYWGWYHNPIKWLKKLWLFVYIAIFVFVLSFGFIASHSAVFSMEVRDTVHNIMIYFISPVPFLILLVLSSMKGITHHPKH
jgi:hypothetical protein